MTVVFTVSDGDMDPPSIRILPINATAVNATWSLQGDKDIKQFILKLEMLPSQEMFKPVNLSSQDRFYVLYRLGVYNRFLALLAKGQKGLCRGDLSVVRASVRKQFLVNTLQSLLLIVSQPNLYSS